MNNEFQSRAIIEKHIGALVAEITCQDDHDLGWVGDNVQSHLTELVYQALALSSDAQKYMETQDLIK